jgi:hypothetical protein
MANKSGTKKASNAQITPVAGYVVGGISFIPLIGIPFGIAAIIIGIVKKRKGPAILGVLGIMVSVVLYGFLFYGLMSKTGPFEDVKQQLANTEINQDKGQLAIYYQQHGQYPPSLDVIQPSPNNLFYTTDPWGHALVYHVSANGKSYTLTTTGP